MEPILFTPHSDGHLAHLHFTLLMLPDPFTTEDGDVILRAGPDDTFRVHKIVLSLASPVFKNLFQIAQPDQPDGGREGLPTITITDPPESVDLLLRFIYPGVTPPIITDPTVLSTLLTIADKYNVQTISLVVKERLADEKVLKSDPFGVYITARRWGFGDEAKRAAREVTLTKIKGSPSSRDPQNLAGEDFFRLLWFMQNRGDEVKRVIRTDLVSWDHDLDHEMLCCVEHNGFLAREYYQRLAEIVVRKFDANPCLSREDVVMALVVLPDPPRTGSCEDIDSRPEEAHFCVNCPLALSSVVSNLGGLTSRLESICEKYLSMALDGEFPA